MHVPRQNRESGWEDADVRLLAACNHHGLAYYIRVGPEDPLPQSLSDHHRCFSSLWRILRKEEPSAKRLDPKHGEKIQPAASFAHAFRMANPGKSGRITSKP